MDSIDEKIIKTIEKTLTSVTNTLNYDDSIKVLKSVTNEIEKHVSFSNFSDYINFLLKNTTIINCLDIIISSNIINNEFETQNIKKIYDDDLFDSLLEMYCLNNNIKIKEKKEEIPNSTDFTGDSFKLYYQEIRKIPLLTREEELYYGKLAQQGNKEAKNKLVEANLRLVVSKALRFKKLNPNFDVLDLIQNGNLGLMRAAELFDYNMGYHFSTYATFWISQGIRQFIKDNVDMIKKPSHVIEQIFKLKKIQSELYEKLNREPTTEELAKASGLSIEKINELFNYQISTTSLNTKVNSEDDDSSELEMFIPDNDNLENNALDSIYHEQLLELINNSKLFPREKEIVLYRYGFKTGNVVTLEELSKKYGLTRERVRQIEHSALRKLKLLIKINDRELYDEKTHAKMPLEIRIPNHEQYDAYRSINETKKDAREEETRKDSKIFKYEFGIIATTPELVKWNQYYRLLRICVNKYGNVPENFKTKNGIDYNENGLDIDNWLDKQKRLYMSEQLTVSQVNALLEISVIDDYWVIMYKLMVSYIDFYREYFINANFKTFNGVDYDSQGFELGTWYKEELEKFVTGKMSPEKEEQFNEIVRVGLRRTRKED